MSEPKKRTHLRALIPALIFAFMLALLYAGLYLDPRETPFALMDKPAPAFELDPLYPDEPGFSHFDLKKGEVTVVNFFATWCAPCRVEHPYLLELADRGVTVYGINYKDGRQVAQSYIRTQGNPFRAIGVDPDGRTAIDWGLSGVPETFIVNGEGRIVQRIRGAINEPILERQIMPVIRQLQ